MANFDLNQNLLPQNKKKVHQSNGFMLIADKEVVIVRSSGLPDLCLSWNEELNLSVMLHQMTDVVFADCPNCNGVATNEDVLTNEMAGLCTIDNDSLIISGSVDLWQIDKKNGQSFTLTWDCVRDLREFLTDVDTRFRE